MRRTGKVNEFTTIEYDIDVNTIEFWTDVGRVARPMIIVYNNIKEYDEKCREGKQIEFYQWIKFTKSHAKGILQGIVTLRNLIDEGVVEYLTPEEMPNCVVAENISVLREEQHNVIKQYTHCEVPQSILGYIALISPNGNHTQPARVTYETNQGRQTGGWYCFNHPYRIDNNRFFQYYNQMPLIKTISHSYIIPNGYNTIVAYMLYTGDNQEDSAIVSQGFVDRGGFFGSFYRTEKIEINKNEQIQCPDPLNCNINVEANYSKLVNGIVPVGAIVQKNDVLIGRVAKVTGNNNVTRFIDKSLIYHYDECAYVDKVIRSQAVVENLCSIKLRYSRKMNVGDKMSSRAGNKSIAAIIRPQSDLPFTEDGLIPDLIINTHSLPSRMTIGQMLETMLGPVCAAKGCVTDGTTFTKIDIYSIVEEMKKYGFHSTGNHTMRNGLTGEHFDVAIFIGPTYHQRLQKFVLDDRYATDDHGPTNQLTHQPINGKRNKGGLKIGEMEVWCLNTHGAQANQIEKLYDHSDKLKIYSCRRCCGQALYNEKFGIYKCLKCKGMADIVEYDSCRSSEVLRQIIGTAQVDMQLQAAPRYI